MTEKLGFHFDQTRCNGCKACQVACADKNDLAPGVRWRRVVEYSGGSWAVNGETFTPNVFSYYSSIACNHCENPACVAVCPTTAMHQGPDGIVTVDATKCIGCKYCTWACPYGAPQYDAEAKHMTKCDMCADYRATGQTPACVAACPSRALDWGPIDELRAKYGSQEPGFAPLPDPSLTKPHLVVTPHRDAQPWNGGTGHISNPEEI